MSEKTFFDRVRQRPFSGRLNQGQVDGLKFLLREWASHGTGDDRHLAYCLATVFHETARTMQPIKEHGGNAYFHRMYDIEGDREHVARELGNLHPGDGVKFAGRGYVQITGRANYARASGIVGHDLIANPDLALRPEIAARILYHGMAHGWFTGRKLADHINASKTDFREARRIVNRLDKADVIATYAVNFLDALKAAGGHAAIVGCTPPPVSREPGLEEPARTFDNSKIVAIGVFLAVVSVAFFVFIT